MVKWERVEVEEGCGKRMKRESRKQSNNEERARRGRGREEMTVISYVLIRFLSLHHKIYVG